MDDPTQKALKDFKAIIIFVFIFELLDTERHIPIFIRLNLFAREKKLSDITFSQIRPQPN